jgi:hypothetical protein
MPKKGQASELWKDDPEEHDFPAAADYLSLLLPEATVGVVVERLRKAGTIRRKAKDLVRSSRLPLLPADDPEVIKDIKRVNRGEKLSPVLLLRGSAQADVPLVVADGYHRICASYHLTEDADIPCRMTDLDPLTPS